MATFRPSTPDEIPQQKALWKKCFGDPDEYIDAFYDQFCTADQVVVAVEDGVVRSMAALLPTTLRTAAQGEELPVCYLYALATDPKTQGQGYARQLLHYADGLLAEQGYKAMILVPASASLHKFFSALGMDECFIHRKSEFMASSLTGEAEGSFTPVSPEEYNAIREAYLAGSLHLSYPDQLIRLQDLCSRMTGGGLYRVEVADDAEVGCAAVEYVDADTLLMKELLTYHQYTRRAVELAAQVLPADRYLLRTPAVWEGFEGNYTQPFAMIKWYDPALQSRFYDRLDGYLGLAFD